MHVSKITLSSILVLLLTGCTSTRKTIVQLTGQAVEKIAYGNGKSYARGIACTKDGIFVAGSDGIVSQIHFEKRKSGKFPETASIIVSHPSTNFIWPELRDISVSPSGKIIAMQSNDSSVVVFFEKDTLKYISAFEQPAFLDGFDILPGGTGFLMGDPVDGHFLLYRTSDHGESWEKISHSPAAAPEEAGYAASGTNVQCIDENTFVFVSGGGRNRFFKSTDKGENWHFTELAYPNKPGCGPFSVHFRNVLEGVIVGGDYTHPEESAGTSYYTTDGGNTWIPSEIPTHGYRSCVIAYKHLFFACGTNGVDYSEDQGKTWISWLPGNTFAMQVFEDVLYLTTTHETLLYVPLHR